jgi:hypothetical protein
MDETTISLDDVMPCPTCAALVRRTDIDEHQRWHAATQPDVEAGSTSA